MNRKTNVFLMVLLSIATMGIYVPYWFLTRKKSLAADELNAPLLKFLLVLYSLSFLYNLVRNALFADYGIQVLDSVDLMITFFGLGIMYFSVFRVRETIEEKYSETVFQPWLLLLFHIWYLQYKLNRLEGSVGGKKVLAE